MIMTEFYIIYFLGALVTFIVSLICISREKLRMTFFLLLLCVATDFLSWLGLGVLYISFKDDD